MLLITLAIINVLLALRVTYLRQFIQGQRMGHKYLKQTITDQAELIDQKDHIIGYMGEIIQEQNERILESQLDGQEIFDKIIREQNKNI